MEPNERRRVPRYPFIANAELIEEKTDTHIKTRVSELSLGGCYLDMLNTLPTGTPVRVKILTEQVTFEAKAVVVYAHPNLGLGVAFEEISEQQLAVLKGWLDEAEKVRVRQLV